MSFWIRGVKVSKPATLNQLFLHLFSSPFLHSTGAALAIRPPSHFRHCWCRFSTFLLPLLFQPSTMISTSLFHHFPFFYCISTTLVIHPLLPPPPKHQNRNQQCLCDHKSVQLAIRIVLFLCLL